MTLALSLGRFIFERYPSLERTSRETPSLEVLVERNNRQGIVSRDGHISKEDLAPKEDYRGPHF